MLVLARKHALDRVQFGRLSEPTSSPIHRERARLHNDTPGGFGIPRTLAEGGQRRGRPSTRWAMMLRWISDVPPAMVPAKGRM